jgi:hypothetical protein
VNTAVECNQTLAELLAGMKRRIVERTGGRVGRLQVEWEFGRIVIRGDSPSYFLKQQVLQAALESLAGRKGLRVALRLEVRVNELPA